MRLAFVSGPTAMEVDYFFLLVEAPMDAETPAAMRPVLHQNHPNPFNPRTTISYYLPSRSRVRLAIYDPAGRLVTDIIDREQGQGVYDAFWDGRDRGGRRVASGVYFYRLTAGSFTETKKLILVK